MWLIHWRSNKMQIIQRRSVFSNNLCRNRVVSLQEVHECITATKTMKRHTDRIEYYNSVGIDYENVQRYMTIVEQLNATIRIPSQFDAFMQHLYYVRVCFMFCISVLDWYKSREILIARFKTAMPLGMLFSIPNMIGSWKMTDDGLLFFKSRNVAMMSLSSLSGAMDAMKHWARPSRFAMEGRICRGNVMSIGMNMLQVCKVCKVWNS